MTHPRWRASRFFPLLFKVAFRSAKRRAFAERKPIVLVVLFALAAACFGRLVADPSALLVDGARPSIDRANAGEQRPVGNDATFMFIPQHLWISATIARFGHIPLWDTRGFGGRPMIGNPQSGMFYPPVWLAWWSGAPATLGWLTVGHLIWGGLGVYVLMRILGQRRLGATVAAGTFLASPLLLAHVFEGHYPHVWAVCSYPWAFCAYAEIRAGRTRGRLGLPVILALVFLAGHPQEWLLLVMTLSAWAGYDVVRALAGGGLRWPWARQHALGWAAALVVSLGMTAVELVPEWSVRPWLRRSHEMTRDAEVPTRHHLTALNGFQLLSPSALGGPADYFGNDNYWETLLSIGLAPLVLGVAAIAVHRDRTLVRGCLALVALSFWFACGRHLGLFTLVYAVVPGMSWFRVPARALFLANLAAAVLAGLGIEALREVDRAWWRRFATVLFVLAVVGAGALCVARSPAAPHRSSALPLDHGANRMVVGSASWENSPRTPRVSNRAALAADRVLHDPCFWVSVATLGTIAVAASLLQSRPARFCAVGFMGLLALGELAWSGFGLLQTAAADRFVRRTPLAALGEPAMPPLRVKARDAVYGDLAAVVDGIEKTNINDPFQLDHAALLYETLYPLASHRRPMAEQLMSKPVQNSWRLVRQAVLERMSVAYLVSDRVEPDLAWPVARVAATSQRWYVIQANRMALPRAYVVPRSDGFGRTSGSDAHIVLRPRPPAIGAHEPRPAGGSHHPRAPAVCGCTVDIDRSRSTRPGGHDRGARIAGGGRHLDAGLERDGGRPARADLPRQLRAAGHSAVRARPARDRNALPAARLRGWLRDLAGNILGVGLVMWTGRLEVRAEVGPVSTNRASGLRGPARVQGP